MRFASLLVASSLAMLPAIAAAQFDEPAPAPAAAPAAQPAPTPPAPAIVPQAPVPQQPVAPMPSPEIAPVSEPYAYPPAAPATAPIATPAATPAPAPEKRGMYFGFSFGTGKGTMTSGGSTVAINDLLAVSGTSPKTLNLQLRTGWGTGDLLFGAQLNWTRTWVDVAGVSAGIDFTAVDLVATWWSQEMGLYARVGVGPSSVNTFVDSTTSQSVSGVELMLGLGFTSGGLGVGIDMFKQSYDASKAGFDSVTYVIASLSLDVY